MQPSHIHTMVHCKLLGCSNEDSSVNHWVNHCRGIGHMTKFQQKSLPSQQLSKVTDPREVFQISIDAAANTWCGVVHSIVDASLVSREQSQATEKKLDHYLQCLYHPSHFIWMSGTTRRSKFLNCLKNQVYMTPFSSDLKHNKSVFSLQCFYVQWEINIFCGKPETDQKQWER